jgi:predicted negative regulator of RcsB-dependent stress response
MATASRRITRKDLRRPDWFQVTSERALEYFNRHQGLVFAALAAVLVIAGIVWGWQLFKERQNMAASQEFGRAMTLYQGEKYREAIPVLETVAGYRWSRYAVVARIYLANSHLATNDMDKAVNEAQRALAGTRPNGFYRQIVLITLATAEEQKQDCKTAVQHYAEAQNISGALQGRAMLGKARCAEALGDTAAAITAYKDYLKDNAGSPLTVKLAELEAKSSGPAVSTAK